jgi:hypothetical protein
LGSGAARLYPKIHVLESLLHFLFSIAAFMAVSVERGKDFI